MGYSTGVYLLMGYFIVAMGNSSSANASANAIQVGTFLVLVGYLTETMGSSNRLFG